MAQDPSAPGLAPTWNVQRAGMEFLWAFHNMREKSDEVSIKFHADDVDLWGFQEISMDKVSQKYNIRNRIAEGRRVFYKPLAECDTAIVVGPKLAARATHIEQDQTRHAIAIAFNDGQQRFLFLNCYLTTSRASFADMNKALYDISQMMKPLRDGDR